MYCLFLACSSTSVAWTVGEESAVVHGTGKHSNVFKIAATQQDLGFV